jgi:hypothetical protein
LATGGQEVAQHGAERGLDFATRLRGAGDRSALLEVAENLVAAPAWLRSRDSPVSVRRCSARRVRIV